MTIVAPRHRLELDTVASEWQVALDAAQHALDNSRRSLAPDDLVRHHGELVLERRQTAALLAQLAHAAGVKPEPWLSATPLSVTMLGLRPGVRACVFDLDGVLTDSAVLHASAWAEVFDDLLLRLSEETGWQFVPFDRDADYRAYIDGRPRLEGIHLFLGSRGIRLPEGRPGDPPDADTAYGLARHKSEALARGMHAHGVAALEGARRYLEAAGHAGLRARSSPGASTRCRCSSSPGSRRSSTCASTPSSWRSRACAPARRRTSCSRPAVCSTFAPRTP